MIRAMRIEALLLLFLSCIPSNTIINLPDRTSIGQAPPHYDPCVRSYTQQTQLVIEEHICVDSMGNTNVKEYWDTIREYPCTWQITKDNKTRCIPVSALPFGGYFGSIGDKSPIFRDTYLTQCYDPITLMQVDARRHPLSQYVSLIVNDRFRVYETGRRAGVGEDITIYATSHSEMWDEDFCDWVLPVDANYPHRPKNYRWFYLGEEVDPALFQER